LNQLTQEISWKYVDFYDKKSMNFVQDFIDWLQKKILNWNIWSDKKDLSRLLSIFSLLLFMWFLILNKSNIK
jgi:hypothetical protein